MNTFIFFGKCTGTKGNLSNTRFSSLPTPVAELGVPVFFHGVQYTPHTSGGQMTTAARGRDERSHNHQQENVH